MSQEKDKDGLNYSSELPLSVTSSGCVLVTREEGKSECRALLIERGKGADIELPKGRFEPQKDGTLEAGALRELREEAGILNDTSDFTVERKLGVTRYDYTMTRKAKKNSSMADIHLSQKIEKCVHYFLVTLKPGKQIKASKELAAKDGTTNWCWIGLKELATVQLKREEIRQLVRNALTIVQYGEEALTDSKASGSLHRARSGHNIIQPLSPSIVSACEAMPTSASLAPALATTSGSLGASSTNSSNAPSPLKTLPRSQSNEGPTSSMSQPAQPREVKHDRSRTGSREQQQQQQQQQKGSEQGQQLQQTVVALSPGSETTVHAAHHVSSAPGSGPPLLAAANPASISVTSTTAAGSMPARDSSVLRMVPSLSCPQIAPTSTVLSTLTNANGNPGSSGQSSNGSGVDSGSASSSIGSAPSATVHVCNETMKTTCSEVVSAVVATTLSTPVKLAAEGDGVARSVPKSV